MTRKDFSGKAPFCQVPLTQIWNLNCWNLKFIQTAVECQFITNRTKWVIQVAFFVLDITCGCDIL